MNQTWTVFSPAKVNLHLSIGAKRDDGYHDAYSVMHALTLHDTLTVACERLAEDAPLAVDVRCTAHGGVDELSIASEDNIAHKAIVALAEECGLSEAGYRFSVHIDKHIPHAAGLGGGSSNAAAALLAACRAFGIESEDERVLTVATRLGADVPFFLRGGCALLGDRGDVFERALAPMNAPVVLVRPGEGVSTAEAYRAFDEGAGQGGVQAQGVSADRAQDVSLHNNLAPASETVLPELAEVKSWLQEQGGVARDARTGEPCVLLSGSGSATFCICESMNAAYAVVSAAKQRGWWARSCSFTSAGARIVERRVPNAPRTNVGAVHKSW